jgi:hypothetical protein
MGFVVKVTVAQTDPLWRSVLGEILDHEQEDGLSGRVFVESRIVCVFDSVIDVPELVANQISTICVPASQKIRTQNSSPRQVLEVGSAASEARSKTIAFPRAIE